MAESATNAPTSPLRQVPDFDLWREDDNGVRLLVGSCFSSARGTAVVSTLERRGHKQRYWVEAREGPFVPGTPLLLGVPELDLLGRAVTPRATLSLPDGWLSLQSNDVNRALQWERPDSGLSASLQAIEFDRHVPFEEFVDHHWTHTAMGYRRYRREELIVDHFAGCEALGYDWGTGVSVIVGWHIRVSARTLLWAACESWIAPSGRLGPPADVAGRELFKRLRTSSRWPVMTEISR